MTGLSLLVVAASLRYFSLNPVVFIPGQQAAYLAHERGQSREGQAQHRGHGALRPGDSSIVGACPEHGPRNVRWLKA